ncbi:MAG TPA: Ig-like domain repeat protein, partial [Thermoplasmata archaeon]|nr:Ig-like domain repeat protein [Thermoplasmata archaeon]
LYYRKDGGSWTLYGNDTAAPWSWTFNSSATGGDGLYEFYSVATDNATNVESAPGSPDASTTVDTTPPTSAADSLPTYETTASFAVNATASDATSGVDHVSLYYRKDGGSWTLYANDTASPWSWLFDTSTTGGDGLYEFRTVAVDVAGNVELPPGSPDATTTVDTTPPTSAADALPTYETTAVFAVTATASDATSGVDAVDLYYQKDGGGWTFYATDSSAPWSFTFNTSATGGDGFYEFYTVAVDNAGNAESAPADADASTTVDTTPPASFVDPLPTYETTVSFLVTATASDETSGVASVELFYRKDGGAWTSYGTDGASPWAWTFDTSTTGGDGFYEFYSRGTDAAGNVETAPGSPDASTTVDTGPPISSVNALPAYRTTVTFTVTATASDAGSGVASVELFYHHDSGPWVSWGVDTASPWSWLFDTSTTGGDGPYGFYTVATDVLGNVEAAPGSPDASTVVDTVAPVSFADALPLYETTPTFLVTATASDATSGVGSVQLFYRKDGGAWTLFGTDTSAPYAWNFDSGATGGDGLYEFRTVGTDVAGNVESVPGSPDASTTVETAAPVTTHSLSGTSGSNGWYRSNVTVTLTATDPAPSSGGVVTRYRVDSGSWTPYAGAFVVSGEGEHIVAYYSYDAAGNLEVQKSAAFKLDTTAPTGTANAQPSYRDARTFEVPWSASDAVSGLDTVSLYYSTNGGATWTLFGSGYTDSPVLFTSPSDGAFSLNIRAFDKAGNTEGIPTSAAFIEASTTVDTVASSSSHAFAGTLGSNGWYTTDVTVTLSTSDPAPSSGGVVIRYRVDSGAWTVYAAPFLVTAEDEHTVYYYATDNAGNVEVQRTAAFKMDKTNPSGTALAQPTYRNVRTFEVTWSASDAVSGLASVSLYTSTNGGASWTLYGSGFTASPILFAGTADGVFRFNIRAFDLAGNSESTPAGAGYIEATTTVDSVAATSSHTFTGTLGLNNWYTSLVVVTLSVADPAPSSGGTTIYYRVDNGAWNTYVFSFTLSIEGPRTLTYYSTDNAENVEVQKVATLKIDRTNPAGSATAQPTYRAARTFDVFWSAADAVSGIGSVSLYYSTNGGFSWTLYGSGFTASPILFTIAAEGPVAFNIRAYDVAGNNEGAPFGAGTIEASTAVDTLPPSTSDDAPSGWSTSVVTVTLTATDSGSGVCDTAYSLDGGPWTSGFTLPVSGEGWHTVTIQSTDCVGNNEEPRSLQFAIDTVAPASAALPLPAYLSSAAITVHFTATDPTSGIASVELWVFDGITFSLALTSPTSPVIYLAPFEGYYAFFTVATDVAGNVEAYPLNVDSETIVDTTAPTTAASAPAGWSLTSPVSVPLTAADGWAGICTTLFSVDGGFWISGASPSVSGDGVHTVFFLSIDCAGNAEAPKSVTVRIDTTPPSADAGIQPPYRTSSVFDVFWSASDATSGVASVSLYYSVNGGASWVLFGSGFTSSPVPFLAPAAGSLSFSVRAFDVAGNGEAAPSSAANAEASTILDLTTPVTGHSLNGVQGLGGWFTTDITVGLSVSEPGGSLSPVATHYRVDAGNWQSYLGAFVLTGDGLHTFEYYSTDSAGHVELARSLAVGIDTRLPSSGASAPTTANTRVLTVVSTASDATSGIASVELHYRKDGGSWGLLGVTSDRSWFWSVDTQALGGDGLYEFYTVATDAAGLVEAQLPVAEASVLVDTVAPATSASLVGTLGLDGWYVSAVTVDLAASDATSGVLATYYRVDGGAWIPYASPFAIATEGVHSVLFYSVDAVGNDEVADSLSVRLDLSPPTSSAYPLPPFVTDRAILVAFAATDAASGVASVELWVDTGAGLSYYGTFPAGPVSYVAATDGPYGFAVRAVDRAGNAEPVPVASASATFVDTDAPETSISLSGTLGGGGWYVSDVTLTLTASDPLPGSGVAELRFRVDGGTWSDYVVPLLLNLDGTHVVDYYVEDVAGNAEPLASVTVRLDRTAPFATANALPAFETDRTFSVSWSGGDGDSGLDHVLLYVSTDSGVTWAPYPGAFTASPITFITAADGALRFSVRGVDRAGNAEPLPGSTAFVEAASAVDTVPPATTASLGGTADASGWYTSDVTVTLAAADAAPSSGLGTTWVRVDDGDWSAYGGGLLVPGDGSHTVTSYSLDLAGNAEPARSVSFRIDTTPPTSQILPLPSESGETFPVSFAAQDLGSGVRSVEVWYRLAGGSWQRFTTIAATSGTVVFQASGDATFEFRAVAADAAGNVEAKSTADSFTVVLQAATGASQGDLQEQNAALRAVIDSALLLLALLLVVALVLAMSGLLVMSRGLRRLEAKIAEAAKVRSQRPPATAAQPPVVKTEAHKPPAGKPTEGTKTDSPPSK